MKVKKQGAHCKITPEGEMTIYQAGVIHEKFKTQLAACESLEIDLRHVTEIDTAGLQLLLALKREAVAVGKGVTLTMHSEAVVDVFELLNVAHEFGDPMVLSKQATS